LGGDAAASAGSAGASKVTESKQETGAEIGMTETSTPPQRAGDALQRVRDAKAWIFDMDGVLYVGTNVLPGTNELLDALTLRERQVMMATNNSMATPEAYERKLAAMGMHVPADAVLTSATATRDYLLRTLPADSGIFVIGMPALRVQLVDGTPFHPVQFGEEDPAALVIGLDLNFTYDKLKQGMQALQSGALFIATNADTTLPTENGLVPGAGSIVAALAAASGRKPIVIGKPETPMLEDAMMRMGASPSETVMIGDRLDTDILAGYRAGANTVLVLTGVSTRDDLIMADALPDLIVSDLPSLVAALTRED
jgi:4-nitrophenyl phosphatase